MNRRSALRDGADTLRVRARPQVVAVTLAKHAPVFTILYAPPAIWAGVTGAFELTIALAVPAIAALFAYMVVRARSLPADLRGLEAMVAVALVFFLGALGAVPAFMTVGMPFFDAVFEAMSGLTTTGLSVASDPDSWPFAVHILRAWLQWVGGLVMATAVLALILPSGVPTRRLGQVGITDGDRIASTRLKARQLLGVYLGLTAVAVAITALVIPDWREALALTLSAISTGGFAPRSDSLASYSDLGQTVVMATCVIGALSLVTFVFVLRGDWGAVRTLGSLRRLAVAVAAVLAAMVVLWALGGLENRDLSLGLALDLISALTTAGFSTGAMPITGAIFALFILVMVLGGDTGSTAGGLKLARLGLLARAARHAIRAPAMPDSAVAPLRHDGEQVEDAVIIGVLALAFIYAISALLLVMQFSLHGFSLPQSLFESISALSTVGLSTGLIGADLPTDLKISLTFAMWLGRLEFIAVLVLFLPRTWMKGS
ncbi:TrkH family potassium uptake protein [Tropicimonas sp. S265A]|uniref:TrkH family potassium uptake protein n=1 Tax=Tropicimonas sp. S265A TaxID=3415134 RepID=UPI003C7A7B34